MLLFRGRTLLIIVPPCEFKQPLVSHLPRMAAMQAAIAASQMLALAEHLKNGAFELMAATRPNYELDFCAECACRVSYLMLRGEMRLPFDASSRTPDSTIKYLSLGMRVRCLIAFNN